MEEQSEHTCDLCKITYASDTELELHVLSIIHHVKMEQRKKGCSHTCSLCQVTCENVIEYCNHYNGDKHKHNEEKHKLALSRKNKDPNSPDILDSFRHGDPLGKDVDKSSRQYDREPEFREPEPVTMVTNRKSWTRSARNQEREYKGGHSRSYSEPEIDTNYNQDYSNGGGSRYVGGNNKKWNKNKKQRDRNFDPPGYWEGSQYEERGYDGQWVGADQNFWNGPQGEGWNWGAPAGYGQQFAFQGLYTNFDNNARSFGGPQPDFLGHQPDFGGQQPHQPDWRYGNASSFKDLAGNFNGGDSNRRGSFDSSAHDRGGRGFFDQERRGRGRTRGNGRDGNVGIQSRGNSKDKSSPDSNSSNDSNGLKRRRDDDHELVNGKLRKGNSNKRIMEVSRPLTPGDDYVEDSVESLLTSKPDHRKSNVRDRSSSHDRFAGSLPVRMETSPSKRTSGRSSERPKQVTWASDTVSSTTDIGHDQQVKKHGKGHSLVSNKRSSSLDSGLKRNKLPDSTSDKKAEKKASSSKDSGKTKGKSRQAGNSPVSAKRSTGRGKDEGESVLEKAEKLCKKLRDEREKGKKDKVLKEKQKKMDKHKELNSQIKELTDKNKAKIKGHLEAAENMLNKNSSGTVSEIPTKEKHSNAKPMGVLEKAAVSLGIPVQVDDGVKNSHSSKRNAKKDQPDIEKIRETIENSVRGEIGESVVHSVLSASKSTSSHSSPKPESGSPTFPSPLAKHMLSKQKSDSSSSANYDTDHLLKMVNSPRSTKERLRIAQMLRTYAKSQTKLSLPRFNLKMSDLCSGSGDRQDEIAQLDLEQMSTDMQLEIANLIEADVKPDIADLEKLLDFQSAANVMLDVGVLNDLGIVSPNKENTSVRSAPPAGRAGSPLVLPSSHRQFSSSESAVSQYKNISVPIKQEHDLIDLTDTGHEISSLRGFSSQTLNRSASPVMKDNQRSEMVDNRPSLSIEDLTIDFAGAKRNVIQHPSIRYKSGTQSLNNNAQSSLSKQSFVEMSAKKSNEANNASGQPDMVKIKEEKMVTGYEKATGISNLMEASSYSVNSPPRTSSPLRQNLFQSSYADRNVSEEVPVRDIESSSPRGEQLTALEKVKSILDEAPNMERVLGYQQGKATSVPMPGERTVEQTLRGKGISLDTSHGSQGSSVLDQVYNISVQEESVRQELSVVNQKISQLQKLMDEAMQQMNKFTEKKDSLLKQEDEMRSTRMKLLQDSRSQSSVGSQPEAQFQSSLSHLTDAQLHNLSNPVFIKFLMSQRNQSDMSSVGGFSNVETGSQALCAVTKTSKTSKDAKIEGVQDGSRRGSFTSNITEPVSVTADRTLTPRGEDITSLKEGDDGKFLTQSVDLLSGSAPSVRSSNLKLDIRATEQISDKHLRDIGSGEKMKDSVVNQTEIENKSDSKMESQNSFSFINSPLDNAGFVTLESLMNQTSDIGKLLQRSLEAEKTKMDSGKETLGSLQGARDSSQPKLGNDQNRPGGERERRDSFMSTGSEDIVVSGSDIEKLSGKVSMKYMGTIPDNVNYTEFMKQIASDSKTKSVMYTVVTSPEAVSQLQKLSDSGLGTGSLTSQGLSSQGDKGLATEGKGTGNNSEGSGKSNTTGTLTIGDMDFESQSVKSTYSLGEQIKRMCVGQNPDTPEPPKSVQEGDKAFTDESDKGLSKTDTNIAPPQSPNRKMLQSEFTRQEQLKSSKLQTTGLPHELSPGETSPTRKKLKSKKERDRKSRRKQKEEFILESSSDTNSVEEESLPSLKSQMILRQPSVPEEDLLVITGSEDGKKTKASDESDQMVKKSLLDEVQLETETQSDSCEDRTKEKSKEGGQRLKMRPEVLESFRSVVKTKLQGGKSVNQSTPVTQYKGPSLSVAAIQVFKEDVYVCYNGSELRRFNLKTGEILKELDCSPYLVQCLLVCSVEEREDILYTGGACKKLMLFKPQKFNLIETYDYDERITCLHGNWGRLFVGLSDGVVSVRSMKTDKELNLFQTTNKAVQCISSTSAGMTKMLCCGCADKIIYVLDAISGILFTMLQGHMSSPLCIEVFDDVVVSGAADKSVLIHNVRVRAFHMNHVMTIPAFRISDQSGSLEATINDHKAMVSQISSDRDFIYTACSDKLIRCYNKQDFKLQRVFYGSGRVMLTSIIHHDGKLLTGNKEGLVESFPISSSTWTCKCDGCKLEFGLQEHLIHHVLSDHLLPNSRMLQCPWTGCSEWLSTVDGSQKAEEHILLEHFK